MRPLLNRRVVAAQPMTLVRFEGDLSRYAEEDRRAYLEYLWAFASVQKQGIEGGPLFVPLPEPSNPPKWTEADQVAFKRLVGNAGYRTPRDQLPA